MSRRRSFRACCVEWRHNAGDAEALAIDLSGIVFWSALLQRYLGRARAELAEDAATAAWEEGRRTRFEHAIALALDARGPDAERDM